RTASGSGKTVAAGAWAGGQDSAAGRGEEKDKSSPARALTTTTAGGSADTTWSASTTMRIGAPLSRAAASTTVRVCIIDDTPSASIAQRANAGLPPLVVTVIPVG